MKVETLLSGGYIVQNVEENLTYDYLHSSEDNLWSILYLTGYLTGVRENELSLPIRENETALMIPNLEIREIFESTVIKWFDDSAKTWDRKALFEAVWNGDSESLTKEMNRLLRKRSVTMTIKKIFIMHFLREFLQGQDIRLNPTKNMERAEATSSFTIQLTDEWQFLKQSMPGHWRHCTMTAKERSSRLMRKCMQKSSRMITIRFSVTELLSSKSAA